MSSDPKRLFLLDGMALVYRAHFAFFRNPRITSSGLNTSAVFGYALALLDILEKQSPSHIAVALDTREPTHRHEEFPEYKANRQATPEEIVAGIPHIVRLTEAFRIPVLRLPGYEADDIIGAVAKRASAEGFQTFMVTFDKDFGQLVDDNTSIYKPSRGGDAAEILGVPEILETWEIERIDQVVDVLGLMGDTSDNVPGVPGIGPKTAKKLIAHFGSIEAMLERTAELVGKQRQTVEEHADLARLSKRLVTIMTDVPIDTDPEAMKLQEPDEEQLKAIFAELEFQTLGKRVFGAAEPEPAPGPVQLELFGETGPGASPAATDEAGAAPAVPTIREVTHDYRVARTPAEREALIRELGDSASFCFDLETTALDPRQAEIVGIAFALTPHTGSFVPFPAEPQAAKAVLEEFRDLFENAEIEKVGHNLKFDLSILRWHNVEVRGRLFDTMLAHYLLEPERRHGMDALAQVYLNYRPIPIAELIGEKADGPQQNLRDVPAEKVAEYAAEDADVTLQLRAALEPKLKEAKAEKAYWQVEAPLIPVLVEMEYEGIALDTGALREFAGQLETETGQLEREIVEEAGVAFNVDSPKQLGEILFLRLNLDPNAKKTSKSGQFATSEQVLSRLAPRHPIIRKVLDYRQMRKLKNTYVDTLPEAVDESDGRVRTNYNQAVAATGRLQSSGPNLQNIPIRTERGQEIRKAFVPRGEGFALLSADYSQIELRIIAEISRDPNMIAAFENNVDIHRATAARVYGVELADVTPEMRRKAKMVNFGIPYGISAFGLAQRLNVARTEGAQLIGDYFAQFPAVKEYMDKTIESARENGYVETMMGRRRYLREINSQNGTQRAAAERNAINSPIQGSAADMIKIAMANIHTRLRDGAFRSKMLLQVHDELVFDLCLEEEAQFKPIIEQEMITAIPMTVPITIDMGVGQTWLEAH